LFPDVRLLFGVACEDYWTVKWFPWAAASAAARVDGLDGHGRRLLRELISCHALAVLDGEQGRKDITADEIIGFSASST